jgi:hypothetical protein
MNLYPISDSKQASEKWANLRKAYKKQKAKKPLSGSGADAANKWAHFHEMTFLDPFLAEREERTSNMAEQQEKDEAAEEEEDVHNFELNDTDELGRNLEENPIDLDESFGGRNI